jgi:hypothetical protein
MKSSKSRVAEVDQQGTQTAIATIFEGNHQTSARPFQTAFRRQQALTGRQMDALSPSIR